MKINLLAAACVMIAAVSCTGNSKSDPVADALIAALSDNISSPVKSITWNQRPVMTDSTTFGEELKNREKIFETKIAVNTRYHEGYKNQGKLTNAHRKADEIASDKVILEKLCALEETLKDTLDCIAYYDWTFNAVLKTEKGNVELCPGYFCTDANGKILNVTANKKALHRGLGLHVIPGYSEILKGPLEEE